MNDYFFQSEAREKLRLLREEGKLNQQLKQQGAPSGIRRLVSPGAALTIAVLLALIVVSSW